MRLIVIGMYQPLQGDKQYVVDVVDGTAKQAVKTLKRIVPICEFNVTNRSERVLIPTKNIHSLYNSIEVVYNEGVPNPLEIQRDELRKELEEIDQLILK